MRASRTLAALLIALAAYPARARAQLPQTPGDFERWLTIVDAEDRRASDLEFQALVSAADLLSPATQQVLVRAMGRLERPSLIPQITGFLRSRTAPIRGEAANALAQALHIANPEAFAVDAVHHLLLDALRLEPDRGPSARGAIVVSLGRLPYVNAAQVRDAETAILRVRKTALSDANSPLVRDVCIALESLIRLNRRVQPPSDEVIGALLQIATSHMRDADARPAAMAALVAAATVDIELVDRALADPLVSVRRQAAAALRPFAADRPDLLNQALRDVAAPVRLEALRSYGANPFDGCDRILDALKDPSEDVVLLAIDLLAGPCTSETADIGEVLAGQTQNVGQLRGWHRGAHAIVALAVRDRRRALEALPGFVGHLAWQVRMYAARSAAMLGDVPRLRILAEDREDNVRQAAIAGLHVLVRHEGDEIYLNTLTRRDYQLLMTAVAALQGTPLRERTSAALFEALARITAEKKETSRDVRLLFLQRLREVGDPRSASNLQPYFTDFDPRVAAEAADLYALWTDTRLEIDPKPLPRPALPNAVDLLMLRNRRAVVRLRWAGDVCLSFRPEVAPLTAGHFLHLVQRRYYDGRIFHRVAAGFLAQGGSPGANDYAGNDRYWRDEVGLAHTAGAIGISSHGRDTADAQFFIDLADNWWLTHDYTVFATASGAALDNILEGDTIDRIDLVPLNFRCR